MAEGAPKRQTPGARRVAEGLAILKALSAPREQQNERSALALLALLGMTPSKQWREAEARMLGITEMMNVFRDLFGKRYAPNTRETVRRFTVHQFAQMGLVAANPDDPRRPVNSPDNRYQVAPTLLKPVPLLILSRCGAGFGQLAGMGVPPRHILASPGISISACFQSLTPGTWRAS